MIKYKSTNKHKLIYALSLLIFVASCGDSGGGSSETAVNEGSSTTDTDGEQPTGKQPSEGQKDTSDVVKTVICGAQLENFDASYDASWSKITDATGLNAIALNDDNIKYVLANNIDLNLITNFEPIGGMVTSGATATKPSSAVFTGILDGAGCSIAGLKINKPNNHFVGLFGAIGNGAIVKDLTIKQPDVTGGVFVGALTGQLARNATVSNVKVTAGSVKALEYILLTYGEHVFNESYSGGLVGKSYGAIKSSSSGAKVSSSYSIIGGLVGLMTKDSSITNSYASGDASGNERVGGLVGYSDGTIEGSYAKGDASGTGNYVGGLVGALATSGSITDSSASGSASGNALVAGLVGESRGTIKTSYATGDASGAGYVGGLAGANLGDISNSYAKGAALGIWWVGGLVGMHVYPVGYQIATITNSYATGFVTDTSGDATSIGNFIGVNQLQPPSVDFSAGSVTGGYYDIESSDLTMGFGADSVETTSLDITGVSAAANIIHDQNSNRYFDSLGDADAGNDKEIFSGWKFGTDENNPWHWVGDGSWPELYWQHQ